MIAIASRALISTIPAIDNLPYGIISYRTQSIPRCAVAIGQHAIDLVEYAKTGALKDILPSAHSIFAEPALNSFAALPWKERRELRSQIQADLKDSKVSGSCLVPLAEVKSHLPMKIGGYSDFYTSLEHCQNCSQGMARSGIFKNWFHAPSVYNSRVSSVVPTGTEIRRPINIAFSNGIDSDPVYGPSRLLDYELEMGYFVSKEVPYGQRIDITNAKEHIFGRKASAVDTGIRTMYTDPAV